MEANKTVPVYLLLFVLSVVAAFAIPYVASMTNAYCLIPLSSSLIELLQLSSKKVISALIWTVFYSSEIVISSVIHILILYVAYRLISNFVTQQIIFYLIIFMITPLVLGIIFYPQDIWMVFEGYRNTSAWIPIFAGVFAAYILKRKMLA